VDLLYIVGGVIYCASLTARGGGALRNEIMKVHYALLFICSCLFLGGCVTTGGGGKKSSGDAKGAKAPVKVTESLKQGLVAYYPFNGNAKDESGNGNHGTVHNAGLSTGHDGAPNSAYYFDGNEWIDVGSVVSRYDVITMSAWVRTADKQIKQLNGSNNGATKAIISKRRHEGEITWAGGAILYTVDGKVEAVFNGYPVNQVNVHSGVSEIVVNDDNWHHVVHVNDGSTVKVFVDGASSEKMEQTYVPRGKIQSSLALFIGKAGHYEPGKMPLQTRLGSGEAYFTGTIDEVRIYERALTAAEVKSLYDSEKP
jgi:hypothetical protein